MWIRHKGFLEVVLKSWSQPVVGEPLFVLNSKLKSLKQELKSWNKEVFGNVVTLVETAEEEVLLCENQYELSGTEKDKAALLSAKEKHLASLAIEEDFLAQKSGIKWMKEGDKSTSYFHSVIKKKNRKKMIDGILDEGVWINDKDSIADSAIKYFQSAFTGGIEVENEDQLMDLIPNLVTTEQNEMLMANPSIQEVKDVVFQMDKNSAAGPDGFNGVFFQHCWEIIGSNVHQAVCSFMAGNSLPKGMSSTVIALIPKCEDFPRFYPSGFIKGRVIQDNLLLAQELIHPLDHSTHGGNVLLKLDMSKAFDMLSWKFLSLIMTKFGFSAEWIDRILACISNSWFSVLLNGELAGFFPSSKGIRQGDPISPGLFALASDYLIRGLCAIMKDSPACAYKTKCKMIIPCLAFADDCLIFGMVLKLHSQKQLCFWSTTKLCLDR
ncbi:hypothetical protein LIER_20178 [Lithospermum erythrorhizon]|uniref:Reverse transcriptase domain-containing protein n=1 Tax=Lithospermum erythrorhizon TaxID=34254 RepID=A0AAV3QNK4_LITER